MKAALEMNLGTDQSSQEGLQHRTISETINIAGTRLPNLLKEYLSETLTHLDLIESNAHELGIQPDSADCLNALFRSFHSIKGNSGFHQFSAVQDLSSAFESLLDDLREGRFRYSPQILPPIFSFAERLREALNQVEDKIRNHDEATPVLFSCVDLYQSLDQIRNQEVSPGVEIIKAPSHELLKTGILPRGESEGNITIPASKITRIFDLISQLAIAQSLMRREPEITEAQNPRLARQLTQLSHVTTELQKSTLSLRTVPLRGLFHKLQRVVESVASELGKSAQLVVGGEHIELDRSILQTMADPLLHMVRNALDHGLETDQERLSLGKEVPAKVHLTAISEGSKIRIELRDDGKGMDRKRILEKAHERGMIDYSAKPLSDEEVFKFIFRPGFSTAAQVSNISGRGVGMDVVQNAVDQLGGAIRIASTKGQGTTFTIHLPVSSDIKRGCHFVLADNKYLIEKCYYEGFFCLDETAQIVIKDWKEYLTFQGKNTQAIRLESWLEAGSEPRSLANMVALKVRYQDQVRFVLVDGVLNEDESVYKILGSNFRKNKLLSSAGLTEDGRVALLLDVETLFTLGAC